MLQLYFLPPGWVQEDSNISWMYFQLCVYLPLLGPHPHSTMPAICLETQAPLRSLDFHSSKYVLREADKQG